MTADSGSASLRIRKQGTGNNLNTWGDLLDGAIDLFDDAIAGVSTLTIPASGDYTLTSALFVADEARRAVLKLTGSPALNFNVIVPSVTKTYWIWNATSVAATITVGGGATVRIDAGDKFPVWCDGVNVNHGVYFGGLGLKDYITAFVASAGAVPSPLGNTGKYLYSDGTNVLWRQPSTADLSDYNSKVLGVQVALAVAL